MALTANVIPKRHPTSTNVWEDSLMFSNSSGAHIDPHGTSAGNTGELRFKELAANGTNYVGFKAADSIASNVIWTLPNADGTAGQSLTTDGSGALSWGGAGSYTGLTLTPAAADYNTLTINHSDGNPRVQIGNIETSNTFGAIFLGNVTPSATNYVLQSNGSSQTNLNGAGTLIIGSSNVDQIRCGLTETSINEGGADIDLRIEGQSFTHGVFYDASTGRTHLGYNTTPSGAETVNILGTAQITDSGTNYDTFSVNFSDGTPRVTMGTFETATTYGVLHLGNVTPSSSNYAMASTGLDLILNSTGAVRFAVSGGEGMRVSATEVIINYASVTHDLRVEGTSLTHGFFYDASTGRLHIGYNTTPTGTATVNVSGTLQLSSGAGFYGTTPPSQATGYTAFTNLATDRTCDANSTTVAELADILGTLIEDLKLTGIIAA